MRLSAESDLKLDVIDVDPTHPGAPAVVGQVDVAPTIADLLGVPQEDRRKLFDWSNQMLAYDDPEYNAQPDVAAAEILGYAMTLAAERALDPKDDIISKLVTADVDGHKLNDDEFGYFVILLAVAGNETTRNTTAWGMWALMQHPEQYAALRGDMDGLLGPAVEEILRWASPVMYFRRTATCGRWTSRTSFAR